MAKLLREWQDFGTSNHTPRFGARLIKSPGEFMGWIIEASDGRVLRISDVGIVLSGSDPHKYSTEKLAQKVAEEVMGLYSAHEQKVQLNVKREETR